MVENTSEPQPEGAPTALASVEYMHDLLEQFARLSAEAGLARLTAALETAKIEAARAMRGEQRAA